MKKGSVTYSAIFPDGSFIEKDTFDEISLLTSASFFLKIEFDEEEISDNKRILEYFTIKPINKEEKPYSIKIRDFEIVDIGHVCNSGFYQYGVRVRVLEVKTNQIHKFVTKSNYLNIFKDDIFPLLEKLNELGSWAIYNMEKSLLKEEENNQKLLLKIEKLENKIKELKEENENFKSNYIKKE